MFNFNAGTPEIDFSQVQIPGFSSGPAVNQPPRGYQSMPEDPATLRELLLHSPHDVALLKERNPPLAEALLSGSLGRDLADLCVVCGVIALNGYSRNSL